MKPEYKPFVDELIELCIREDIGDGDHTSLSCIPADEHGRMRLLCKQEGTIAGIEIAQLVLQRLDPEMKFEQILHDGDRVAPGDVAFYVSGRLRSLLQAERILLNIMQRMSGVATQTAVYVKRLEGLRTKVLDTRKTTPGMRIFEKEAVRLGGGANHRYNLSSAVMLKDNHIDAAGGIAQAVAAARAHASFTCTIEVECETLDMVREAVDAGADIIMLDNMDHDHMARAIALIDGRAVVEASGNVDLDSIRELADLGVDVISSGALTHSAGILDLSLKHLRMIEDEGVAAGAADIALHAGEDK